MSRTATVTAEHVAAAAAELKTAGIKPTLRAVRDSLGGGSMTTIQRHLARWNDGQPIQATAAAVEIPAAALRGIQTAIEQAVHDATAHHAAELADMRAALDAITAEAERTAAELANADQEIEHLRKCLDSLSGEHMTTKQTLENTRDQVEHERAAAEHARTELAKAQLRLDALPGLQNDIFDLREIHETLRNELATNKHAVIQARTEADALRAALEIDRARLAKAETDREAERQRGDTALAELATTRVQVSVQQTSLDATARELAQAYDRIREIKMTKAPARASRKTGTAATN